MEVLILVAWIAAWSPVWVPAAVILRRANVEGVVIVAAFIAWAVVLQSIFGLENLRVALGWTIGPGA